MVRSADRFRKTGLSFVDSGPVTPDDPNRMDIALFVGFAVRRAYPGGGIPAALRAWLEKEGWGRARGGFPKPSGFPKPIGTRPPADLNLLLNIPVPIDNWQVFETLFESQEGLLPAAVRAFFAQGGRKCYVVRAADPPALDILPAAGTAQRTAFINRWVDLLVPGFRSDLGPGEQVDPFDNASWRGLAHLYGLPQVAMLVLPDLPALVQSAPDTITPAPPRQAVAQSFLECSEAGAAINEILAFPEDDRSPRLAPRCDEEGYAAWQRALNCAALFLKQNRRDVQLLAAVPIPHSGFPHSGLSAAGDLLDYLANQGERGLSEPVQGLSNAAPNGGLASAFIQLAYPWLRIAGSEGLIGPDGVLAGLLARNALTRGAFRSAAGLEPIGLWDTFPRLGQASLYTPQPYSRKPGSGGGGCAAGMACRSLVERVSLFGPTPGGQRLLSDVTTSLDENYRPAGISRLVGILLRSSRRLGENLAFESSSERLWARLRSSLERLLLDLYGAGAFQGAAPADAFQVRCDRSTMSQNDLDAGRVVAEISFSASAPIEQIQVILTVNESGQVDLSSEDLLGPALLDLPITRPRELLTRNALPALLLLKAPAFEGDVDNRVLLVAFDGWSQEIRLSAGVYTPAALVEAINAQLRGGYARLTGTLQGELPGCLAIGSDHLSTLAAIAVGANPALGFPARSEL